MVGSEKSFWDLIICFLVVFVGWGSRLSIFRLNTCYSIEYRRAIILGTGRAPLGVYSVCILQLAYYSLLDLDVFNQLSFTLRGAISYCKMEFLPENLDRPSFLSPHPRHTHWKAEIWLYTASSTPLNRDCELSLGSAFVRQQYIELQLLSGCFMYRKRVQYFLVNPSSSLLIFLTENPATSDSRPWER